MRGLALLLLICVGITVTGLMRDARAMQNTPNSDLLHPQIWARNADEVASALGRGANPNERDDEGRPALWLAAAVNDIRIVRALIRAGADPNAKGPDGSTALMHAAFRGDQALVRALLDARADVNAKDDAGSTALIRAAMKRRIDVVRVLLDSGADPNIQTLDGKTALSVASWQTVEERVTGESYSSKAVKVPADDPLLVLLTNASTGRRP